MDKMLQRQKAYNDLFFDPMRKNTKERAIIYVRVSTDEQAKHGYSLDMQKDQCKQFLEREGYILDDIFIDDGYTAKNMNRPALKKMLQHIKINYKKIGAIVVWRLDRLCRNTDDYHSTLTREFQCRSITLLSATETNDVDTPFGRYIRNTQINNAELESNLTSIRTIANLREKAKQGSFPGARVPIGYMRIGKDRNKTIVPDPDTAPFVKEVFHLYSKGIYSYATLAKKMRDDNWIIRGRAITKKLIENILVNNLIFYIGKFNFAGETYEGKHEPILSKEGYLSILHVRGDHGTPKTQRHNFLYRGLIKCAKTGQLLTAETHRGAHKSGNYIYYRCPKNCSECSNKCKQFLKEETIEESLKAAFDKVTLTSEQYDGLRCTFKSMLEYQRTFDGDKKKTVEREITRLRNRISHIYEDKLDGLITSDEYIEMKTKWEQQLEEKLLEYSALNKTNIELIKNLETLSEPLKNLSQYYFQRTDDDKRHLIKLLCPNLFYDGSKVVIIIKSAFTALFEFAIFVNGAGGGSKSEPAAEKILTPDNKIVKYFKKFIEPILDDIQNVLLVDVIKSSAA